MNVHHHVSVLKDLSRAQHYDPIQSEHHSGRYVRPYTVNVKAEPDQSAKCVHPHISLRQRQETLCGSIAVRRVTLFILKFARESTAERDPRPVSLTIDQSRLIKYFCTYIV